MKYHNWVVCMILINKSNHNIIIFKSLQINLFNLQLLLSLNIQKVILLVLHHKLHQKSLLKCYLQHLKINLVAVDMEDEQEVEEVLVLEVVNQHKIMITYLKITILNQKMINHLVLLIVPLKMEEVLLMILMYMNYLLPVM